MRRPQPFYKRMRYVLETVLVYIVFFFFRLLPLNAASALGGSLFKAIGPLLSSSKTAYKGLSLAFPDKPADEKLIVKLMWENLGRVAGEYPHLDEVADNVELEGGHYLEAARDSGKPVIFFGAHLANWEVPTVVAKKIGLDIYPVYRRPNNTGVENLLRKARGRSR